MSPTTKTRTPGDSPPPEVKSCSGSRRRRGARNVHKRLRSAGPGGPNGPLPGPECRPLCPRLPYEVSGWKEGHGRRHSEGVTGFRSRCAGRVRGQGYWNREGRPGGSCRQVLDWNPTGGKRQEATLKRRDRFRPTFVGAGRTTSRARDVHTGPGVYRTTAPGSRGDERSSRMGLTGVQVDYGGVGPGVRDPVKPVLPVVGPQEGPCKDYP